jgi:hypothetical protein
MGEIRDASLRKGIRYICEKCDMRRMDAMVELHKKKSPLDALFGKDFFK